MASEGLRSPAALLGVVAAHMALAWSLSHLMLLHPTHVPEPILVALVSEPEPDVQAQPLPQADVPLPVRRRVPPRPPQPVVPPETEPPPPLTQTVPAIEPLPPAVPPVIEPSPVPPVLAREPVAPLPVIAAAPPSPSASTPEPAQPAPAAQPEAVSDTVRNAEAPVPPLFAADYLRNPKPNYPMMSRRLGEEGLVTLRVFVTAGGEPRQVELKESCGFPRLDYAALEVVRNWRFVPAKRGDAPVDAWVVVPIRFTLKG